LRFGKICDVQVSGRTCRRNSKDVWDIGLIGAEPQRAETIAFTSAYAEIDATYLVPSGSRLTAIADVDSEGVRIAVTARSAYGLWLDRNIKHAEVIRSDTLDSAYEEFVNAIERARGSQAASSVESGKIAGLPHPRRTVGPQRQRPKPKGGFGRVPFGSPNVARISAQLRIAAQHRLAKNQPAGARLALDRRGPQGIGAFSFVAARGSGVWPCGALSRVGMPYCVPGRQADEEFLSDIGSRAISWHSDQKSYPTLQVTIYDSVSKSRTLVNTPTA
jgi:hypothetical protein